jgi:hypothetical protein
VDEIAVRLHRLAFRSPVKREQRERGLIAANLGLGASPH